MQILIIEPERALLNSLTRYLESKGYESNGVFDGVIGINEFDTSYDVVIINQELPRLSYLETTELLKEKKKDVKIFVLSEQPIISSSLYETNQVADAFISFPFTYRHLDFLFEHLNVPLSDINRKLTIEEAYLINEIQEKEEVEISSLSRDIYRTNQLNQLITAINKSLKGKKIITIEKGLKMVNIND